MFDSTRRYLTSTTFTSPVFIGSLAAAVTMLGIEVDRDSVTQFFSETINSEITKAGFFFAMAAWIHSGRVKKEIRSNFESLTGAINNVAVSLRNDLKSHSEQIDNLRARVDTLEHPKTTT